MGLAIVSTPSAEELQATLAATPGVNRLDSVHLVNARAEECDVFVTRDGGLLDHRVQLERLVGFQVIPPEELLARLATGINQC